jgi:RimJ/RimL family protein N-acetyltransferase
MTYTIKQLHSDDDEIIKLFHQWKTEEKEFEFYTCRPVKELDTLVEYKETMKRIFKQGNRTYYLSNQNNEVLGKVTLFDINVRNKSAEFGYYFPQRHRAKGYGSILLSKFIPEVFSCSKLGLNKLYATTASSNLGSIRLLEKCRFKLDGIMREHYWIKNEKQDQHCYSLLRSEWESETD